MGTIKLQCQNCGGICDVSEDKSYFYCLHCGTKCLIKEDVVTNIVNNNNITNNTTNVETQNVVNNITQHTNIVARFGKDAVSLIDDGDILCNIGDIDRAADKYLRAVDEDPRNAVAWAYLGLTDFYTKGGLPSLNIAHALPSFKKALKLADESQISEVRYVIDYSMFVANQEALLSGAPREWKELFRMVKDFSRDKFSRELIDAVYDFIAVNGIVGNRGLRKIIKLAKQCKNNPDGLAEIKYYSSILSAKEEYKKYTKKLNKALAKL